MDWAHMLAPQKKGKTLVHEKRGQLEWNAEAQVPDLDPDTPGSAEVLPILNCDQLKTFLLND